MRISYYVAFGIHFFRVFVFNVSLNSDFRKSCQVVDQNSLDHPHHAGSQAVKNLKRSLFLQNNE